MNKIEFMEGVHILQDNYNRTLSETQLKLFYENLKDMSKDKYISNIKEYIKTNSFMPTISQIRNETNKQFVNYEQRNYSDLDFNKFYANKGV
jgi:hypothetical protein